MSRIVLGPIAHSGPAAHTEKRKSLVELVDGEFAPTHADAAAAAAGERNAEGDKKKKAADWVSEIEKAEDQEQLDTVLAAYAETGKEYSTVEDAAEKKQAEFDDDNS